MSEIYRGLKLGFSPLVETAVWKAFTLTRLLISPLLEGRRTFVVLSVCCWTNLTLANVYLLSVHYLSFVVTLCHQCCKSQDFHFYFIIEMILGVYRIQKFVNFTQTHLLVYSFPQLIVVLFLCSFCPLVWEITIYFY